MRRWLHPESVPTIQASRPLSPFLKWPGGKTLELQSIAAAAPTLSGRFIDPFVGGGSVLLATPAAVPARANDACRDLVEIYSRAAAGDRAFRATVDALAGAWDRLADFDAAYADLAVAEAGPPNAADVCDRPPGRALQPRPGANRARAPAAFGERTAAELRAKFGRIRRLEARRGTLSTRGSAGQRRGRGPGVALHGGPRSIQRATAGRPMGRRPAPPTSFSCASSRMPRCSGSTAATSSTCPTAGSATTASRSTDKARLLFGEPMLARLATTEFHSEDFEPFLAGCDPATDDFVFVDPPYDSDFSAYDNRAFGAADQVRLEGVLGGAAVERDGRDQGRACDPGAVQPRSLERHRGAQDVHVDDQVAQRPPRHPPDDHELRARGDPRLIWPDFSPDSVGSGRMAGIRAWNHQRSLNGAAS